MSFPEYRRAIELSDEEILDVMRIVYPDLDSSQPDAPRIKSISRDDDTVSIEAESAYELFEDEMEEDGERFGWAKDGFEINDEEGLVAYDFSLEDVEWRVRQKLLSLGCNLLLKDNEFLV